MIHWMSSRKGEIITEVGGKKYEGFGEGIMKDEFIC